MALSPSHKFGQIIGDILENAMHRYLKVFADKHNLYLDSIGPRPARSGKKVSWIDSFGNKHDLDFVLERNGTSDKIGVPVAFIESAWRRYTKHSRNKAQEIQGAILPLATTHSHSAPFLGVILAGVFTEGALAQLKSRGFEILYFEYESVQTAFSNVGLDASFDEDTSAEEFSDKIKKWEDFENKQSVIEELVELNRNKLDDFLKALEESVNRYIHEVRILPLYGNTQILPSINDAITFLNASSFNDPTGSEFIRFDIRIIYSNGDKIEANFANVANALSFLSTFESPDFKITE